MSVKNRTWFYPYRSKFSECLYFGQEMENRQPQFVGKMKENFKEFLSQSSMHGLAHIYNSKSPQRVIVWSIVSISALAALVFHIMMMVSKYFEYGYTETASLNNAKLIFPDVTICSYSAFNAGKLWKSNFLHIEPFFVQQKFSAYQKLYDPTKVMDRQDFLTRRSIYANTKHPIRDEIGYKWEDIVLNCKFMGQLCRKEQFEKVEQTDFFNCYTFMPIKMDRLPKIQSTGPQDGLSMVLFGNNHEVPRTYSFSTTYGNVEGIRIHVHEPGTESTPLQSGFDVPPGMSTSVSLSLGYRKRLPAPYTDCHEGDDDRYDSDYTITSCRNECLQYHILGICGCLTAEVPTPSQCRKTALDYCLKWNPEDVNKTFSRMICEKKEIANFNKLTNCGNCTLPCGEIVYSMAMSQSKWPSLYEYESLLHQILRINNDSIFPTKIMCKALLLKTGGNKDGNDSIICENSTEMYQFYEYDTDDGNQSVPTGTINTTKLLESFPEEYLYSWVTDNLLRVNIYFGDDINIIQVSSTI